METKKKIGRPAKTDTTDQYRHQKKYYYEHKEEILKARKKPEKHICALCNRSVFNIQVHNISRLHLKKLDEKQEQEATTETK